MENKTRNKTKIEQNIKRGAKYPAIIGAALQVFGEKGFHNTTITDIARKAKVSESTIYECCGNKEDILFAIPEEIAQKAIEFVEAVLPFVKGAENRLRAAIYGIFTLYRDNPSYSALVLFDLKQNKKYVQSGGADVGRRYMGMLGDIMKEGIESGEFRDDINVAFVRSVILGTINQIFWSWHILDRRVQLPDFVDDLVDMVMAGVKKTKSTSLSIDVNLNSPESLLSRNDREGTSSPGAV